MLKGPIPLANLAASRAPKIDVQRIKDYTRVLAMINDILSHDVDHLTVLQIKEQLSAIKRGSWSPKFIITVDDEGKAYATMDVVENERSESDIPKFLRIRA